MSISGGKRKRSSKSSRYEGKGRSWKSTRVQMGPSRKLVMVSNVRSAVSPTLVTKLQYTYNGASITANQDFNKINLNSLFDPDRSYTGHQPYGFDQLAALYKKYRVDRCDCDIQLVNVGGEDVSLLYVSVPSNETTDYTILNGIEMPFQTGVVAVAIEAPVRFKRSFYPHVITGVTKEKYMSDDLYAADVGASPTEALVLHQLVSQSNPALGANSLRIIGTITYTCTFYDALVLGPS